MLMVIGDRDDGIDDRDNSSYELMIPVWTPDNLSTLSSSIYYCHPPLPLPSQLLLLLLLMVEFGIVSMSSLSWWVYHHHHPLNMLNGRSVARDGEGGLAVDLVTGWWFYQRSNGKEEKKKKIGTVSGELALSGCVYRQRALIVIIYTKFIT